MVFTDINAINIFKCSFPNDMLFLSLYGPKELIFLNFLILCIIILWLFLLKTGILADILDLAHFFEIPTIDKC